MAELKSTQGTTPFQREMHNPFVHPFKLSTLDKFQIGIMSVTLVPIRLLGLTTSLVIAWIFASIALFGRTKEDEKRPLTGWRSWLRPLVVLFSRGVFFMGGFHWVEVKGKRALPSEAPLLATAPHSTYFDGLPVTFLGLTSVVAKSTASNVPFFGKLTKFTQPVFVSREDPNSRQNTIREIRQRAQTHGEWPQIIIFPEGTCTNRKSLITYKPGAFYPGVPVQPVCIRYPNKLDTYTWTWEGPTAFRVFWYTMCQFHNRIEIEFLPVYTPSEEEKNDPKLFGDNVRDVMAKALGVPVTDHTYEDCRLMKFADTLDMPMAARLVNFNKTNKRLKFTSTQPKVSLQKLVEVVQSGVTGVSIGDFAAHLNVDHSAQLEDVFALIDQTEVKGCIDLRQYLLFLHLVTEPADREDTLKFAFQVFDVGCKGRLTPDELSALLRVAYGMDEAEVTFIQEVTTSDPQGISYDEFKAYASEKAELTKLFVVPPEVTVFDTKLLSNGMPWSSNQGNGSVDSKAKSE